MLLQVAYLKSLLGGFHSVGSRSQVRRHGVRGSYHGTVKVICHLACFGGCLVSPHVTSFCFHIPFMMASLQDTPARNQDEATQSHSRQSSGALILGSNSQSLSRALFSSEDTEVTKGSGSGSGGHGSGAAGEAVVIDPPPEIGTEPPPSDNAPGRGDTSPPPQPQRRIRRRSSLVLGPTGFSAALAFLPPMSGAPNSNSEEPARSL